VMDPNGHQLSGPFRSLSWWQDSEAPTFFIQDLRELLSRFCAWCCHATIWMRPFDGLFMNVVGRGPAQGESRWHGAVTFFQIFPNWLTGLESSWQQTALFFRRARFGCLDLRKGCRLPGCSSNLFRCTVT
jgi:hypothetical protein